MVVGLEQGCQRGPNGIDVDGLGSNQRFDVGPIPRTVEHRLEDSQLDGTEHGDADAGERDGVWRAASACTGT